jgi:hypothetical protein
MTLKQLRGVKLSCRSKSGAAQLLMKKDNREILGNKACGEARAT